MKNKLSTITTIVFGLMIFSLVKYYIKESEKQVTKEPIVDTITIIDKNKPILIPQRPICKFCPTTKLSWNGL